MRMPKSSAPTKNMEAKHDSVLLEEVMEALAIAPTDTVVDATLGGAGHFARLLRSLQQGGTLLGIDADLAAVHRAQAVLDKDVRTHRPTVYLVHDNFRNLEAILTTLGVTSIDKVLFDLGWSGYQLAGVRGFSFQQEEPLLMTYGAGGRAAAEIVNTLSERELADILFSYGEERFARPISRAIVAERAKERILSTSALVRAVMRGTPRWYQHRKIHPATKTFQAIRIAANDELVALRAGLTAALSALSPGGKIAVITFHSIEDRIVKSAFRDAGHAGQGLMHKRLVTPGPAELAVNRRARSAKLRVFEKSCARLASPLTTLTYV